MPHFECGAFNHSATSPGAKSGLCPRWSGPCNRRGWLTRQGATRKNRRKAVQTPDSSGSCPRAGEPDFGSGFSPQGQRSAEQIKNRSARRRASLQSAGVGPPYAKHTGGPVPPHCNATGRSGLRSGGVMRPFHANSRKKLSNSKLFLTSPVKVTGPKRAGETRGSGDCSGRDLFGKSRATLRAGAAVRVRIMRCAAELSPFCLSSRRSSARRSCRSPCLCGW
jgi:hypothetical protein